MGDAYEPRSGCPINATIEVFGDRWSLLVLRDIAFGDRRYFRELQAGSEEGIASNILADRLKRFVELGLLTRADTRAGQRARYSLTEPAIQLVPVFAQLGSWGLRHRPTSRALRVRAELLEQGGPALWQEFMDELRRSHLGSESLARSPSVRERLNAAYLAATKAGPVAYQGLILDFGGVVTTDFYRALSAFCERQGLPPDAVLRVLRDTREGREALVAVETGHLAQADYETILASLLGVSPDGLLGRALADLRPRQGILDLIHDARDAGIQVGILSNSWGTGSYDPYDGYGLDRLVDAVVISDQVGLRKPDPSIYKLTAAKIGIPPEACVFVDDTAANLPAASKLGMKGVHFTDARSGVAEIRHLLDLT